MEKHGKVNGGRSVIFCKKFLKNFMIFQDKARERND